MKKIIAVIENIYRDSKKLIIFIFFLSIIFSTSFLFFFKNVGPLDHRPPGTDYLNCYAPMADSILSGKGIVIKEDFYVRCAPGYPLFLAPIFYLSKIFGIDRIFLITVVNVIFTALATIFLFLAAQTIFSKRLALIGSILWASYPFNLWFIKNPNTEVPFILLLYAGLFLYLLALKNTKKEKAILFIVGIILGFNSLVRPIGIGFALFLAFSTLFLFRDRQLKNRLILVLLLLLGDLLVIVPWEVYIFNKTGNIIPLSTIGPEATKFGFSFAGQPSTSGYQFKASDDLMEMMRNIRSEQLTDNKSLNSLFLILKNETVRDPIVFIRLILLKAIRSWYATSEMWWEDKILLIQAPYVLTAIFGLFYGLKKHKDKLLHLAFLFIVVFYFWVMTTATLSIMRYMVPAMGIVVIFSAIFLDYLLEKIGVYKKYATIK